ncbi:Dynamin family protein [Aspergillus uvarum CBS 121591]|uniref:Dynamin family protein n=1 Tax=Aspergillus uvarum CBS 121591 TaxID=1448315 RepID=A0A319BWU3_9EURO|nr:Dynamin family protein [Aspergillus uvarum CBS 121591]PYH78166.1 Dynamin family protein [Aspergillus uvarum CBS 121591]
MPGPSLKNDSINIITHDMKTLVKKIQDLRHLGIEDSQIALPRICVIGDQSAGKSSLIEGMSEIKVPRAAGTCTRCPMEINLTESDPDQPWTCRVYLSRKYFYDTSQRVDKVSKKSHPFGPWHVQDQEDELFITLSDRDDVEEAIRWAQLAILNPGRPTAVYIPGQNFDTDENYCQVKFSPNVVRLDISAPGFPSLSFYDLPGVISQAEHEKDRYLVAMVENLVKEYITQANCIVLLTLPMTNDATNSSAARLMREVKSAKARTLGVLTKPDRIQTGESYVQWVEILEGEKFRLGHGYYVIRNNPDPTVQHAQARLEENAFFASEPWATELAAYQEKFGTRKLQTALSSLLLDKIQSCLPKVIEQIEAKSQRIDAELQTLPDPPSASSPFILCQMLNNFREHVQAHMDGGSADYPLLKMWFHLATDFKRVLIHTRPTVGILSQAEDREKAMKNQKDDDSDSEVTIVHPPTPAKRKALTHGDTPDAKRRFTPDLGRISSTSPFDKVSREIKKFTWEDIRECNETASRGCLPDQIDPKAIEILNQRSVEHWKVPLMIFLDESHDLVKKILLEQIDEVFVQYQRTNLYREIRRIVEQYLQKLHQQHIDWAEEVYEMEHNKPFTMNRIALEQAKNHGFSVLVRARNSGRYGMYQDRIGRYPEGDIRRDNELKSMIEKPQELEEILGPDQYLPEMRIMAYARGYYDVASSRFVDLICQSTHTKLFSKCRSQLIEEVQRELHINDHDSKCLVIVSNRASVDILYLVVERCCELMAEEPERQHRRLVLQREKEKIVKAQTWLSAAKKDEPEDVYDNMTVKSQPQDDWAPFASSMDTSV